jgi:hypothetical protein
MGPFLPVAFIIAAYIATVTAVIVAIETVMIAAIIAAIVAAGASIAATYYYLQGDIQNSMLFSGIALAAGVGGVYVAYTATASNAALLMAEGTTEAIAASEAAQASLTMQIAGYASTVYNAYSSVAEALHLKLLYQVHQIAYLVSEDYRVMAQRIFNQIAEVSQAYGFGGHTLNLLFENTRATVLDVTTSMGNSFDVGEVKWLSTYNQILKEFSVNATNYAQNPHALLYWITNNVQRPGFDAKSATMRATFTGIESALGLIKSSTEAMTRIKNDLNKLIADLPAVMTRGFKPDLDRVNRKIDDFIRLNYDPVVKQISASFKGVAEDLKKSRDDMSKVNQRLARPGRYLAEIKTLPPAERAEDEREVSEIVSNAMSEEYQNMESALQEEREKALGGEE